MMIQHNDFLTNFAKASEFADSVRNESRRSGKTLREGTRRRIWWHNVTHLLAPRLGMARPYFEQCSHGWRSEAEEN